MGALIDPQGVWWASSSGWLRMSYGVEPGDNTFDFPLYAVRNLGFVRLRHDGRRMHVCFRSGTLTKEAIDSVAAAILEVPVSEFGLDPLQGRANVDVISNAEDAVERFIEIAAAPDVFQRPAYHVQPLSLLRLRSARLAPLRYALAHWKESSGRLSRHDTWQAKQDFLLLACVEQEEPVIQRIRGKYSGVNNDWLATAVGTPLKRHPDAHYGTGVASSYKATAAAGRPLLEMVNAKIIGPDQAVHSRYVRLLLPWSLPGSKTGTQVVSSCSIVRISLPAMRRPELHGPGVR